ncbi:MAG: hypothetical protein QF475_03205 [Candidatus Undinarchaeales archaeon]|jgi:hypothetical protein|nr:hypothetical protein [Candidatus Undinarchaeales archaeon]
MLPVNIIKIIGEPGKNAVLILDVLFKKKAKASLHIVYADDIRAYCVKNPAKFPISPAAAVSEAQVLNWYGVVKVTKHNDKMIIEKDKMFDEVAKLAKKSKPKTQKKVPKKKPSKSFESIFDSFLVKPKPKKKTVKKSVTKTKKKVSKSGKRKLHILQNSKKRNTKQKTVRRRKVPKLSGRKSKSKRPRARNTKKPLRNVPRHAGKRGKGTVRSSTKARKTTKRKTKR